MFSILPHYPGRDALQYPSGAGCVVHSRSTITGTSSGAMAHTAVIR
jgi:hypothetical protein